jgi:tRNA(fMet)-specific endonuclease VapC
LWLSVITIGELLAGFARGNRRRENEQRLAELLNLQGVGILLLDGRTPGFYANVWNELRANGRRIPSNDIWIAALAIQHDLILDSRDHHFQLVPGLKLLDTAS